MMTLNTKELFAPEKSVHSESSIARVDTLMQESDCIYDDIDRVEQGEVRYRRQLRVGINMTAVALREGMSLSDAGNMLGTLGVPSGFEAGPLDHLANTYADVQRATLDRHGNPETDARHAIHVMRLAVPYAAKYYPRLDSGKIAAYSLLHDIVEAYADDTPSLGITPEQMHAKNLIEAEAMRIIAEEYGREFPEFVEAIEAYEALHDAEARFNKTFDKLDPGFTHFYTRGSQLIHRYNLTRETFMTATKETTERMQAYAGDFPELMDDRDELTRRVADVTFND